MINSIRNSMANFCLLLSLGLTSAVSYADNIILINPFNVPENKLEESIQLREKARNYLSTQPGYVSTELHSPIQPNAEYQLINIAEWSSPNEFKAATTSMRAYFKKNKIRPPVGLKPNPGLCSVIRK